MGCYNVGMENLREHQEEVARETWEGKEEEPQDIRERQEEIAREMYDE